MSFDLGHSVVQPIQILIEYKQSEMVSVSCNSALIDHFLANYRNTVEQMWKTGGKLPSHYSGTC